MADDNARYEYKSARTTRGRQASAIAKWQYDGWELVTQSQGRLRTKMTFRRVKPKTRRRKVAVSGGLIVLLVITGIVAGVTDVPANVGQAIDRITDERVPPDSDGDGTGSGRNLRMAHPKRRRVPHQPRHPRHRRRRSNRW